MRLGPYLFLRLKESGVDCTFGVPGDFVLPHYRAQAEAGMRTVVCTHEPNAAFAADAYARLRGLGVVLATYGAGALNVVNAVAMSYAEHTPLLVISGAPERSRRGPDVYIHHMVKSLESQLRVFREITESAEALDDPGTAAQKIDAVLDAVLRRRRPGYLEIPRDLVQAEMAVPDRAPVRESSRRAVDPGALQEAVHEIVARLEAARNPALYVGVGVRRFGLTAQVLRIAERWGLPAVTSVMGKASFPESHPQFGGVYMGALGNPTARRILEDSDCVLSLGVIHSDVNTGFWTAALDPKHVIEMDERGTKISHHHFEDVTLSDAVAELAARKPSRSRTAPNFSVERTQAPWLASEPLTTQALIHTLQGLDQTQYSFLADVGDAWFVGLELRADVFLAPGYYATMGFAVPGALGAGLADRTRRPFVLVGDGAFQMTGAELSTIVREGLRPIILILNNGTYMMLESLDAPQPYYRLNNWDYVALGRALGCPGERVSTFGQWGEALERAERSPGPYLIEAQLDRNDPSPVMRRIRAHLRQQRENRRDPRARAGSSSTGGGLDHECVKGSQRDPGRKLLRL